MSKALLQRARGQAAPLPEEWQNSIAAVVLELAAATPSDAGKRRAAVDWVMLWSVPDVYIIGGPNGAGKTTTALRIFPALGVTHFINADAIAQGLSPLNVESAARAAGRLMIEQMETRLASGDDFALESTLASRSLAPFIERCKDADYRFTLIYVWLRDADLAVERVAQRVKSGGHDIPDDVIRRRYERGRVNFFELYQPLVDKWSVWNNSDEKSVEVANGTFGTEEILQPDIWESISI